jgi:anaerobic selenocysteine-containing dehydrogenase
MQDKYQSRRDFLKKMALTGSMVTLAASPWLSAFGQTTMVGQEPSDRGDWQLLPLLYTNMRTLRLIV